MNIAIIGVGRQGHRRAKAVLECGDKVVMAVDTNAAALKSFCDTYNCATSTNWNDATGKKGIDAVIVCTPNDTHAAISIAALQAGKSVLCEKPLARNPEEATAILDALKKSKAILKCGFNLRHHPAIARAKRHVESGEIGKVMFIRARYGNTSRPDFEKDWRTNYAISGGGELMDQGMHAIDLFRWFGGEISEVIGHVDTLAWDIKPVEDNAFVIFRGKAGHVCQLHTSWSEWRNIFSFEIFGNDGYAKIEGLGGSYGYEKLITGKKDLTNPFVEKITEFKEDDISWKEEWKEFVSAIKEKRPLLGSAYDGWAAVKLAYAAYASSKSGKTIKVDFKGE